MSKKNYQSPFLKAYGDVEELTQNSGAGATAGVGLTAGTVLAIELLKSSGASGGGSGGSSGFHANTFS